jgi:hypothetical protein
MKVTSEILVKSNPNGQQDVMHIYRTIGGETILTTVNKKASQSQLLRAVRSYLKDHLERNTDGRRTMDVHTGMILKL